MTEEDRLKLKKELEIEKNKRIKINSLIKNKDIKQFVKLLNLDFNEPMTLENWKILKYLLKSYKIRETNGIYVCTGNYAITRQNECFEPEIYEISFDEYYPGGEIYREYKNIESDETLRYQVFNQGEIITTDFENKYLVFNPHNSNKDQNGIDEVRKDFFETSIEKNQSEAKILLLKKYSQMGNKQITL